MQYAEREMVNQFRAARNAMILAGMSVTDQGVSVGRR
jgi:hypothetical protein